MKKNENIMINGKNGKNEKSKNSRRITTTKK